MLRRLHHAVLLAPLFAWTTAASALEPTRVQQDTSPHCVTRPIKHTPKGLFCGVEGIIHSPIPIATAAATNVDACRATCLDNQPDCDSFSYGPGTTCVTYSDKVIEQQFHKTTSGVFFWNHKCFHTTCTCKNSLTACSGSCVDVNTDNNNCGQCSNICDLSYCCGGLCTSYDDPSNCGTCGNVCPSLATCEFQTCVCPGNDVVCGDRCVNTGSDANNCGGCGNVCPMGIACSGGTCPCPSGESVCNGTCSDPLTDSNNCGSCGNVCPSGTSCSDSLCCPTGSINCGGSCVEAASDPNNCGGCGNLCTAPNYLCSSGQCVCPTPGDTYCGTCTNLSTDAQNCGECYNYCGFGQSCINGGCVCPSGQAFCGLYCTDLSSDPENCGNCNNLCDSTVCVNGACT